jgi:hypothetical protein
MNWESDPNKDPEVIAARGGLPQLEDRLNETDAQLAETTILDNQPSLLNKMKNLINANSMSVVKNGTGIDVFLTLDTGNVVRYQFRQNADNLLLLRGAYACVGIPLSKPTPALNGDFIGDGTMYTTTVGDSFSFTFKGNGFKFNHHTEVRGGLWRFSIEELGLTKDVSCYSNNAVAILRSVTIFDNLPLGDYTVKAVFMGEDTVNPSATPRGYLAYSTTNTVHRPIEVIRESREYDDTTSVSLLSSNTILDFAISARPLNATYGSEWVPAHSVSGVSISPNIKIFVDGVERGSLVGAGITNDYHDVKSIEISQRFKAINPNGTDGEMWEHFVKHKISVDNPYLEIANGLRILQDLRISDMYFTMLGTTSSNFSRLVLSNGKELDSIPSDGSELRNEGQIKSVMYAGEYQAGRYHACAVDQESYMESAGLLYKDTNTSPTDSVITFREDGVSKFYVHCYSGVAKTGDIFKNLHRISIVSGVRYPNTLLKSI